MEAEPVAAVAMEEEPVPVALSEFIEPKPPGAALPLLLPFDALPEGPLDPVADPVAAVAMDADVPVAAEADADAPVAESD